MFSSFLFFHLFIDLTFTEFVNHNIVHDVSQLDFLSGLLLNLRHFVEGLDQTGNTFFTVNNTSSVHNNNIIQKDIDSVAFLTQNFPFLSNVNITLYPSPDYLWSYKNDTGVNYSLGGSGNSKIPVYKIPNVELATSGGLIVSFIFALIFTCCIHFFFFILFSLIIG